MRRLRDEGEHGWIARLTRRLARARPTRRLVIGPGDDAAVVRAGGRPLVLTTDALVEGVHFRAAWLSTTALGRRAFAASASDLAAMGAVPRWALVALEAPGRMGAAALDGLLAGFTAAARAAGAHVIGGNLVRGPHLAITTTLVGEAPGRVVTRAGARPGDLLYVTGTLGAAGLAVRRLAAGRRVHLPAAPSRLRAGIALAPIAHAMIDVSDGLLQDLGHLCRASGVGAEVALSRLPVAAACRRALGGGAAAFAAAAGEDYELLVALPAARARRLGRLRGRSGCRLTCVGRVTAGRAEVRVLDPRGRPLRLARRGFDHYR